MQTKGQIFPFVINVFICSSHIMSLCLEITVHFICLCVFVNLRFYILMYHFFSPLSSAYLSFPFIFRLPLGYGFVTFDDRNTAQNALRDLNGKKLPNNDDVFIPFLHFLITFSFTLYFIPSLRILYQDFAYTLYLIFYIIFQLFKQLGLLASCTLCNFLRSFAR